jgi:hypothetical protein
METVEKLLKVRDLYKKSIEAQTETELRLNKIEADFDRKIKAQKKRLTNSGTLAEAVEAQRKINELEHDRNTMLRMVGEIVDNVSSLYTKRIDEILGTN